ncbi:hypothetical protein KKE92_04805 [Candidatus Micrarchaeota archaeon]|nr:hypothetical protein [Candidatus Micrarchaeota archaeon]
MATLDLTSVSFILLIINYISLAGIFLLRYFNPKKWSAWLVKASASYFVVYTITMFVLLIMFFVILLLPAIELMDPSIFILLFLLGFLFLILVAVKKQIENLEGGLLSPFLLYLFSVGQEVFYTVTSKDGMVLLLILIFWYFIGAFVILLLGKIIGYLLDKLFPKIAMEHMKIMKSKFGNSAPSIIKFDDGSVMTGFGPTAEFAGMGIGFALWMISRHFVFGIVL